MKVTVCGSGPGGMAIAAHLSAAGREVTLADLPEFPEHLAAIASRDGVEVRTGWGGAEVLPVAATHEVGAAIATADLVVVSVPWPGHERWSEEAVSSLRDDAALLFMGGGSGALVARRSLLAAARPGVLVGETNCLPLIGRVAAPGAVVGDRKAGGVLLAAIPSHRTEELLDEVRDIWPFVEPTRSVFETALVNYDAIDTVPTALANAGTIEGRPGGVLMWGEGASPSVVRLIEALDAEVLDLRQALGGKDDRRYRDFLIAQGLAPDVGDLDAVMRAGGIVRSVRSSGSGVDLEARVALDTACTVVLASSIGRATSVPTPVIDGLTDLASAMLGRDLRGEGRTLASLGIDGLDAAGLVAYADGTV